MKTYLTNSQNLMSAFTDVIIQAISMSATSTQDELLSYTFYRSDDYN